MTKFVSYKSKKSFFIRNEALQRFLHSPWSGGVMLVIFAVLALILANLPWTKHLYHAVLTTDFTVGLSHFNITKNIEQWINDGLMAIFFFYVGLEIKREVIAGQLSSFKQAAMPIAGAIGGMIVPAIIYAVFNMGGEYSSGWGIPMATDIAFAIGILSLMGDRVPVSLKIFLTALAIADDLGAILVIALFYSTQIDFVILIAATAVFLLLLLLNRLNIYRMVYYLVPAIALWILFLYSGVHATIAGVLIAMTLPTTPRFSKKYFKYKMQYYLSSFKHHDKEGVEVLANHHQMEDLSTIKYIASNTISPSQRLEHSLHLIVAFFIMPVFALANAGVEIGNVHQLLILENAMGLGVFFGLVVGKPLGIFAMCYFTYKLGIAEPPKGSDWKTLFGVACLGGIGFTMSIFIDNLAFDNPIFVADGKIAVLLASLAAAVVGAFFIHIATSRKIENRR